MMRVTFTNAKPNANIKVNNQAIAVNKYVLTLSSTYFDRYFFDDRYPAAENIELPESTTIEDFKRMLATLPPEHRELDDDCVEAVIILADRFFMDNVMEACRNFLNSPSSKKPTLFKFRMAHKYGWSEMKNEILASMRLSVLNREDFLANAIEFALLDDDAKAAIAARHSKLIESHSISLYPSASFYC